MTSGPDLSAPAPGRAGLADLRAPARRTAGPGGPGRRSALCLEWLDELPGEEQRSRRGRAVLLDRDRPAVQAGTPCRIAAGGEPCAAGQDIPDRQHDAEVDAPILSRVMQPVVCRA